MARLETEVTAVATIAIDYYYNNYYYDYYYYSYYYYY